MMQTCEVEAGLKVRSQDKQANKRQSLIMQTSRATRLAEWTTLQEKASKRHLPANKIKCDTTSQRNRLALALFLACLSTQAISSVCGSSTGHLLRLKRQDAEATPTASSASDTTSAPQTTTATPVTTTPAATDGEQKPKGNAKLTPVNYTLVEELFNEAIEDESAVAQKWRHMDKQMTDGVRALLKMIFPHVVSMSADAKVSGACSGAILKWILNLRNLRTWSVKMLDAIGKPSAGLLEGSLTMFGNYKQCLEVRAPDEDEIDLADGEFREYFRGQYCVLELKPHLPKKRPFYSLKTTIQSLVRKAGSYNYYERKVYDDLSELAMAFNFVNIRADLCVPSLCSRDDIQRVADFLGKKTDMRTRVQRCDVMPQENDSLVDESQILWAVIFAALLLLVAASTLSSIILRVKQKKTKAHSLATSMSLQKSLGHMKSVQIDRINDSKPVFLYTIRLILILWFCLCSLTNQLNFQFLRELMGLRELIMHWPMQIIVNSSLQFDAIILITAFTYSYQNINSNMKDLVKYNVGKYSRLMPSIMLMVALVTLTPLFYMNVSPVWHDFVDKPAQVCKSNGFINLFFLQNFLNYDQICLPHTWLFCVELQLCILTIPIVLMMNKNFDTNHGRFKFLSFPVLLLVLMTALGTLTNFLTIYTNSLPAAWFLTFPDREDRNTYFTQYLAKTWSHLIPFAVGLFAGHLCRCQSIETFTGRPYGKKCCDTLMLATSGATMAAIIFGLHSWSLSGQSHLESPISSALYAGLAPLLWSISWALILFYLTVPNAKNRRPSISSILTFDAHLIRLGRLSFLAYLIFPYVNEFVLAVQEQAIFSSLLILGHTFIGNLVLTFVLAIIISALVELPCRRLIKKLALGSRRQCTNLGIITRQLDIHQQMQGPSHDSFSANQHKQQAVHQPMIPMK